MCQLAERYVSYIVRDPNPTVDLISRHFPLKVGYSTSSRNSRMSER